MTAVPQQSCHSLLPESLEDHYNIAEKQEIKKMNKRRRKSHHLLQSKWSTLKSAVNK